MTRKSVDNSAQQIQPHEDHWLGQWACSLCVILFLIAFGFSGQILPRCTSEQGMCTPGDCTCPFPLMKRDLVTQDAQACSQCVEEFCPAVIEGDLTCSTAACDCEDPSWPRIDVGSADKPCMQCVHPHVDVTLRREGDGECLSFGENRTCTVFRYNGAAMIDKTSNRSSCLAWSNGEWQLMPCQGTPDSSAKFTQRGSRDEAHFVPAGASSACTSESTCARQIPLSAAQRRATVKTLRTFARRCRRLIDPLVTCALLLYRNVQCHLRLALLNLVNASQDS
eukprot:symbB.v1.2.027332.t1/scaffold2762.1/size141425/9